MTNQNRYIFTTTLPLATKFGRIVTWLKGLLLIKSYDPLITESCKIIWKTKVISLQPMITKLGSMMTYLHCHETLSLSTWSCKPMWQTEIISPLWLPMPAKLGRVLTYFKGILTKVTWLLSYLILQDQFKNILCSLPQCLLSPNLAGWWLTLRGLSPKVTWAVDHVV